MTEVAFVVLAAIFVAVAVALLWFLRVERLATERREAAWAKERMLLVNRVLAHTPSEVVALDRSANREPREQRESAPPVFIEGLS